MATKPGTRRYLAKPGTRRYLAKHAKTMDELLAKIPTPIRGLARGQTVEGTVVEVTGKSLILDIGAKSEGIVAEQEFREASDFAKKLSPGDKLAATVIVPEAQTGQVLLSIREAAQGAAWEKLAEALRKKEEVEVRVESQIRGGLQAYFSGLMGFIPASHLGKALAQDPQKSVGRLIKVRVIELDRAAGRVVFSEKAVSEAELISAQERAVKKIKVGEKLRGKVVGITSFGIFVQVEKDGVPVDGLVHLSELSWKKVEDPREVVDEGQEVDIEVIGKEDGRLAFSVKRTEPDPWEEIAKKYKPDSQIKGVVTKVGDFGAFVELEEGVEGLLHISKIPAGIALKEGERVDCFVEEVEAENHRISLGLVLKEKPIGYK